MTKKVVKLLSIPICILYIIFLAIFMTACVTTSSKEAGTDVSNPSDSSAGSATEMKTTEPQKGPPAKISMVFGTSGIKFGDVDPGDNFMIDALEKIANIEFTEIITPEYTDYKQKLNLIIASGNIPDVVHSYFMKEDIDKYGREGAFLPLQDEIMKSPVLKEIYEESISLMKTSDNNVYGCPALSANDPPGTLVRGDILDDVNNGVIPKTVDDWYQVFKKIKEKYPDSIPFSGRGGLSYLDTFFDAFGSTVNANGAIWDLDVREGVYKNSFEIPGTRKAVEFYRKLYEEKLLDPTFFTNTREEWMSRMYKDKFVMASPGRITHTIIYTKYFIDNCEDKGAYCIFVETPYDPDSNVHKSVLYGFAPGKININGHMLSVSSQTKEIDGCMRLIEAFLSEEFLNLIVYGREGIEHNIVNGEIVMNYDKHMETEYRRAYSMMYSFASETQMKSLNVGFPPDFDQQLVKKITEINNTTWSNIVNYQKEYTPAIRYWELVKPGNETQIKINESYELSKSIILKAIVGEITMDEYDQMVANYLKTYSWITEELNTTLSNVLKELGVKGIGTGN